MPSSRLYRPFLSINFQLEKVPSKLSVSWDKVHEITKCYVPLLDAKSEAGLLLSILLNRLSWSNWAAWTCNVHVCIYQKVCKCHSSYDTLCAPEAWPEWDQHGWVLTRRGFSRAWRCGKRRLMGIGTGNLSSTHTCRRFVNFCSILAKHESDCPVPPKVREWRLALSSVRHLLQTKAQASRSLLLPSTYLRISIKASSGNMILIRSWPLILTQPWITNSIAMQFISWSHSLTAPSSILVLQGNNAHFLIRVPLNNWHEVLQFALQRLENWQGYEYWWAPNFKFNTDHSVTMFSPHTSSGLSSPAPQICKSCHSYSMMKSINWRP